LSSRDLVRSYADVDGTLVSGPVKEIVRKAALRAGALFSPGD